MTVEASWTTNISPWTYTVDASQVFQAPKMSDWECYLLPHYVLRPTKGNEPNWFWRKMQYLAFGFRWVKRSPNG